MAKKYKFIFRSFLCLHYRKTFFTLLGLFLLTFSPVFAFQQTGKTVRGTVTGENNTPLQGVSVQSKNTGKSTITNSDGSYAIVVNGPNDIVSFTFIGYTPKQVPAGTGDVLNIPLSASENQLKEVVVIGYGTSSKRDVTGSITSIKSEDFNQGVITTPAELLQGKVAGLNVTKSGDPNQQPAVILRGPSTLRVGGAQQPFYVIDGVPGASIDLLAPADIESIDVLKDAASTAIYGSRAANGVIIVTTKKARVGQTRLSYSAYAGVEKVSKKIDMLSADELRKYLKDNGQTLTAPANDDESNTDWQNLVEKTGYSHNHNLSFGGASKSSDYGVSVNYLKSEGILKNSSLERTIFKGYINQRFFEDRLKLGISLTQSGSNIYEC